MRYLGKNGKHTLTVVIDADAEPLLAAGYEEFPSLSPSTNHRYRNGQWVDASVRRHFGRAGKFELTVVAPAEDSDHYLAEGYEEYPSAPSDANLYRWDGTAWVLDLAAYKTAKDAAVRAEALRRAQQSFTPQAFAAVYQDASTAIAAATDQAGVDAVVAGMVWPE